MPHTEAQFESVLTEHTWEIGFSRVSSRYTSNVGSSPALPNYKQVSLLVESGSVVRTNLDVASNPPLALMPM